MMHLAVFYVVWSLGAAGTSNGLLFHRHEELVIAAGEWMVHADLHVRELGNAITDIEHQYIEFCKMNRELGSRKAVENPLLSQQLQNISREYKHTLSQEILNLSSDFDDLAPTSANNRATRGLVGVLGHGLHYLAGTATNDQIKALDDKISSLTANTSRILESRFTFLVNVSNTMKRHDQMLSRTTKALQLLQAAVDRDRNTLADAVSNSTISNEIFNCIHFTFTALSRHVAEIQHALTVVRNRVALAEIGKLTPAILPIKHLSVALQNATRNLPPYLAFVLYPSKDMLSVYSVARVRVIRRQGGIELLVILPLQHRDRSFMVHRVVALPTPLGDGRQAVIVRPESPYLAVASRNDRFMSLPTNYEQNCIRGNVLVCPPEHIIRSAVGSSCSIAMFLNDSKAVEQNCETHLIERPYFVYIKGQRVGEWLYSVSEQVTLNMFCRYEHNRVKISGQGRILLPSGCSASDGSNELPMTPDTRTGNISIDVKIDIEPLPEVNVKLVHSRYVQLLNRSGAIKHILTSMKKLHTHNVPSVPVEQLHREVKILTPIQTQVQILQNSGLAIGVLFLVFLIVIGFVLWKRRNSKTPKDSHEGTAIQIVNIPQANPAVHVPLFPPLK